MRQIRWTELTEMPTVFAMAAPVQWVVSPGGSVSLRATTVRRPKGATENAAVVQALIDNLIEPGLNLAVCRLFIVDGAKALNKAIRRTFGAHTPMPSPASR